MSGVRDVERGLSLDLRVVVYTNDKMTKDFLEREALRLSPGLKRKSGARYRLNRWREDRIANGVTITYRDLVEEYVRLSQTDPDFPKTPREGPKDRMIVRLQGRPPRGDVAGDHRQFRKRLT